MIDDPLFKLRYPDGSVQRQGRVLQHVYDTVFDAIAASAVFDDREHAAVASIRQNTFYTLGESGDSGAAVHGVKRWPRPDDTAPFGYRNAYEFHAPAQDLDSPYLSFATCCFIAAHEMYHAIDMEYAATDPGHALLDRATTALKTPQIWDVADDGHVAALAKVPQALWEQGQPPGIGTLDLYANAAVTLVEAAVTSAITTVLSTVVGPIAALVTRETEENCDEFALRVFPDADLGAVYHFLAHGLTPRVNAVPPPLSRLAVFADNVADVLKAPTASHPTGLGRYYNLVQARNDKPKTLLLP